MSVIKGLEDCALATIWLSQCLEIRQALKKINMFIYLYFFIIIYNVSNWDLKIYIYVTVSKL